MAGRGYTSEGGTSGVAVAITDTGSGDAFNVVSAGTGATLAYDTAHPAHGTKAIKVATGATSTTAYAAWTGLGYATTFARVNTYLTALPTASAVLMRGMAAANQRFRVSVESADGKIRLRDSANNQLAVTTATAPIGAPFRVVVKAVAGTAAAWFMKVYSLVDSTGTPTEQFSGAAGNFLAGNFDEVRFGLGAGTANVVAYWLDDMAVDDTLDPGPALITITPSGLAVPVTLGTPATAGPGLSIAPAGLPIALALGSPTLADGSLATAPAGLAVPVNLGAPALADSSMAITPSGLAVPVHLGQPAAGDSTMNIGPGGLAVPVALGTPAAGDTSMSVAPAGLAIPVALGQPDLSDSALAIGPTGLAITIALGQPSAEFIPEVIDTSFAGLHIPLALGTPAAAFVWPTTGRPATIPTDRPATVGTARPATVATARPGEE